MEFRLPHPQFWFLLLAESKHSRQPRPTDSRTQRLLAGQLGGRPPGVLGQLRSEGAGSRPARNSVPSATASLWRAGGCARCAWACPSGATLPAPPPCGGCPQAGLRLARGVWPGPRALGRLHRAPAARGRACWELLCEPSPPPPPPPPSPPAGRVSEARR